jgi:hypothetical protein|tara:strand:- start:490 stop:1878 length:1389 start_codon:yes stop_codon:yes gene_type:complete
MRIIVLIGLLIASTLTTLAEEITTGNLLPNVGNSASNAQSVDNSIPSIGNDFNQFTSSNATDFTSEVEVTGTGTLSYNGTLIDITTGEDTTTQQKLDNGITLQGNTVVQNCEWSQSSYACGNRGSGRDSYSTKIQVLDSDGSVLSETNQIRNNDAGYNSSAFKYTDTVIYNDTGANRFNWQWTGIDGQANPGNLGGPNLLGANLFMTYDNSILDESVTEELNNVTENLTNVLSEVIIEKEEVKIKATPSLTVTSAPTTKAAPTMNTAPVATQKTTTTSKVTQKTTTTTPSNNAKSTTNTSSTGNTKAKPSESKKENSKESNSKVAKNATTKKESSTKQKSVQSKESSTGENKTELSSGSVDMQMAKVDSDIKDIGKNLEIKNIIKLKAMVNNEMITAYNVPFYKGKDIYVDQLDIFDKPIYQDVNLGQYILSDPVIKSKIKLINIKDKKQKLLRELEVLKNG